MGGIYTILKDGKICEATIRKTAKKVRIVVGDKVQLEKNEFSYDEFSIWYYNQTNDTIKKRYNEFWFKRSN